MFPDRGTRCSRQNNHGIQCAAKTMRGSTARLRVCVITRKLRTRARTLFTGNIDRQLPVLNIYLYPAPFEA